MSKKALGKGLNALIQESRTDVAEPDGIHREVMQVEISKIHPNPDQPRRQINRESLQELSNSIRTKGVIQPIVLESVGEEYTIVAGERRFQAAKIAGLNKVPAIVGEFSIQDKLEISLIENIQREDLNPVEEAAAYRTLIDQSRLSQEALAERVGKKRSTIANSLRLLRLPGLMQKALVTGDLTAGHARAILSLINPADREVLFNRIRGEGYSVRRAEAEAEHLNAGGRSTGSRRSGRTADREKGRNANPAMREIEDRLIGTLGTKVVVKGSGEKGKIEIQYFSMDDLDRILEIIAKASD